MEDTVINPVVEGVVNSEEEVLKLTDFKGRFVLRLADRIYNTQEVMDSVLDEILKKNLHVTSMEQYVFQNFSKLLPKFPDLRDEYVLSLRSKRKKQNRKFKKKNR